MFNERLYLNIQNYIAENFVEEPTYPPPQASMCFMEYICEETELQRAQECADEKVELSKENEEPKERKFFKRLEERQSAKSKQKLSFDSVCYEMASEKSRTLNDMMKEREETFSQSLLRLIDQKGTTDVDVYKKAGVDRKLFSKIRGDIYYRPSKPTAIALAIALKLTYDETLDLIGRAGFTLSASVKSDLIIRFFLEENNHNLFEINEALFAFEQPLLGV